MNPEILPKTPSNGHSRSVPHAALKLLKSPGRSVQTPDDLATKDIIKDLTQAADSISAVPTPRIERFVDKCVDLLGKPAAVWIQSLAIGTYVAVNSLAIFKVITFDPYPYLFLNTLFSVAAAFTTTFVLNSNRRQDAALKSQARANSEALGHILKIVDTLEERTREPQSKR